MLIFIALELHINNKKNYLTQMSNPHQFHNYPAKASRKPVQYAYQKKPFQLPASKAYKANGTTDFHHTHVKPVTVYVKKHNREDHPKEEAKDLEPHDHKYYALPKEVCVFAHLNEEQFPIPEMI